MLERRGVTLSYRTLLVAAGVLVALFAAWSKRDALAEWWNRPPAPAVAQPVAPVVNVPAPVVNVDVKPAPELPLFVKDKHEYEIAGRRCINVVIWRGGWVSYNDAETGEWKARFGGEVKRIRAKAEVAE